MVPMSERTRQLLAKAMALTAEERADLAVDLIAGIDGGPDADAAWAAEIERRAKRALSGASTGTDWQVVRERIERTLEDF